MKAQKKLLALKKTQIAKINSFQINGGIDVPFSSLECMIFKSRTIITTQTQTHTYALDCESTAADV
jgi:hypothetical protein